jgi:hypothetical protein
MPVCVRSGMVILTEGSEANVHDGPAAESFPAAGPGEGQRLPPFNHPVVAAGNRLARLGRLAAEHHVVFGRPVGHIAPGSFDLTVS